MSTVTSFDVCMDRIGRGERLSSDEIRELAARPDILSLGMLADAVRRRLHDTRVTFLRVADVPFDAPDAARIPAGAREVRLMGSPQDAGVASASIAAAKAVAGDRVLSGFSWTDLDRWSAAGAAIPRVLAQLRGAGLDALAELPLDEVDDQAAAVRSLRDAGFTQLRVTVSTAPADLRVDLFLRAGELQDEFGCIQSINPLPMTLSTFRPTTGYEDVKMVAVARLAAPNVPSIQIDWRRYGPKLAQVALTFGADDIEGVSGSDEASEGRRRAPLAEIVRNIEAAGLAPVERDGRFTPLS